MRLKYDSYDLFAHTDEHLTRPKIHTTREKRFYPSEASIQLTDSWGDKVTHGTCMRSAYYRLSGDFVPLINEARSEYIFMQGKEIERFLIDRWKEMGIWVDNNVKFVNMEYNISGELDVLLAEPSGGQLYIVEVKSFYGYQAEKEIFGDRHSTGYPKMSHLLQTLIYLYHFRETIPYGRLAYFARDSVKRRTFKIELHQENGLLYPKVEGNVSKDFAVQDILGRYTLLKSHIDTKTIPLNDFELDYSAEKVEDYFKKKKISKTKHELWTKGKLKPFEHVGDWECNYCKFKEHCWDKAKT